MLSNVLILEYGVNFGIIIAAQHANCAAIIILQKNINKFIYYF